MSGASLPKIKTYLMLASEDTATVIEQAKNVIGVVEFNGAAGNSEYRQRFMESGIPYLKVRMTSFDQRAHFEVWQSSETVTCGAIKDLRFATDGYHVFAAVSIKEKDSDLAVIGEDIYDQIFSFIDSNGPLHISRLWNYIPFIAGAYDDAARYKQFCLGRANAFDKRFANTMYPAATGIGDCGDSVNVCFLATGDNIHKNLENPRQVPAYKYPWVSGLKPPSFSRGTYSEYSSGLSRFYVSGTASILGHETVYKGDIENQCKTTIDNIACLISRENFVQYGLQSGYSLYDLDCIKVYIKDKKDFAAIESACKSVFAPGKSIVYLQADICRADLLVEIEGLIQKNEG